MPLALQEHVRDEPPVSPLSRRRLLGGAVALALVPLGADRASATPESMAEAMQEALGSGAKLQKGRITVSLPELAENGNAVPIKISVESPMTADDHVKSIFVFSEKNPVSNVARFHLGPRSGVARVQTNIRLADTQQITVVARMRDGSLWSAAAEVIVTQAACIDGT